MLVTKYVLYRSVVDTGAKIVSFIDVHKSHSFS